MSGDGRDWERKPIDASALQSFDLDLRLSCGKLTIGRIELGKAAIALSAKNRQLTVAIGEAQFYGGTLRGNAVWNAAEENPTFRIDANLGNFDLERGLGGLTGFRRLEGKGSLTVAVTSKGKSVHEIAAALSGKVQLAMRQGTLAGINAEAVLRRLERRPLSGTGDLRGGRTPFDRLSGNLEIDDGVGRLTNFDIESPILKINLQGETSLVRRDFDLRGTASLIRAAQAGSPQVGFDLPFLISGTWDNPYLLPDPEALIRHSGATAPLLDAVRGRTAREAMRSVIEMVTGLRSIGELPANPSFEPPAREHAVDCADLRSGAAAGTIALIFRTRVPLPGIPFSATRCFLLLPRPTLFPAGIPMQFPNASACCTDPALRRGALSARRSAERAEARI